MKYVLVSGGVLSGLGKGITTSSLGLLLKRAGVVVTAIKIDPYLNQDAGTMSPYEHGECFVLADGGEVDLDLGNYERFMDLTLTRDHNLTTGKVMRSVLNQEREGKFLGKTVQMVPHVTDHIQAWLERVSEIPVDKSEQKPQIALIELGGTVGDIESEVFLEALRQFRYRLGPDNFCHVHVSLVPTVVEPKTKPIQHSVQKLFSKGLPPDLIACRCDVMLSASLRQKIAMFGMMCPENVISLPTVTNLYHVPRLLHDQNVPDIVAHTLQLSPEDGLSYNLKHWRMLEEENKYEKVLNIAVVGKYTHVDSYLSLHKALHHAARVQKTKLNLRFIDATTLSQDMTVLYGMHGIIVPGGFGVCGVHGMIRAIQYAYLQKIPFLGICLGMQLAVVAVAQLKGFPKAHTVEMIPDDVSENGEDTLWEAEYCMTLHMPEISTTHKGGTMRLGAHATSIQELTNPFDSLSKPTLAFKIYGGRTEVIERHRHRYEIQPSWINTLENQCNLIFSGKDRKTNLRMEIVELSTATHPFFFATQYHPEFLSRPFQCSPIFLEFLTQSAVRKSKVC